MRRLEDALAQATLSHATQNTKIKGMDQKKNQKYYVAGENKCIYIQKATGDITSSC